MRTSDFRFDLPQACIAQHPPPQRTDSRMMIIDCAAAEILHASIQDFPNHLHADDLLVMNDTRVMPARLFGSWDDTGGALELLLVEALADGVWDCMHKTRRRIAPGQCFTSSGGRIRGRVHGFGESGRLHLRLTGEPDVMSALDAEGVVPLPPYIERSLSNDELMQLDRERYQTVFAREPGAVAAPTAGLHFSEALLDTIAKQGTRSATVTLHVGPGTFKPVSVENLETHEMHAEWYRISATAAAAVKDAHVRAGRVVAVGTTSVRTLESSVKEHGAVTACEGQSRLFIYPPYRFGAVDSMLTNFHLPESTLLMMVSAFAAHRMQAADPGRDADEGRQLVLRAYEEAIREHYRFYSYGDCMLLK
jgi:S-adenosylmethionine:tRNA ribosyltransferase-isomerase